MYPLSFCSLLALTMIFERAWALRRGQLFPIQARAAWAKWLQDKSGQPPQLAQSILGLVLVPLGPHLPMPLPRLEERFSDYARQVRNRLDRGVVYLDTIAGVAPLLGLLGTALGMIRVFAQLSATGAAKMEALSSGISEALFTTVAGLCIGIPALVAANLFARHIDNLMLQLEDDLNALIDEAGAAMVEG